MAQTTMKRAADGMTNGRAPMTNEARMTNDGRPAGVRVLVWGLGIDWSLDIGHFICVHLCDLWARKR